MTESTTEQARYFSHVAVAEGFLEQIATVMHHEAAGDDGRTSSLKNESRKWV